VTGEKTSPFPEKKRAALVPGVNGLPGWDSLGREGYGFSALINIYPDFVKAGESRGQAHGKVTFQDLGSIPSADKHAGANEFCADGQVILVKLRRKFRLGKRGVKRPGNNQSSQEQEPDGESPSHTFLLLDG
jgi:hypothetical protein